MLWTKSGKSTRWVKKILLIYLFGSGALIVGKWGLVGWFRKSHLHFYSWFYSRKWGREVSPRFHFVVLVWIKITKGQCEPKFFLCNPRSRKILLRASANYNKLLGRVAIRILPNIHNEVPPMKTINGLKTLTVSLKIPTLNCIPNRLRFEKCSQCGVQLESKVNGLCNHRFVLKRVVAWEFMEL